MLNKLRRSHLLLNEFAMLSSRKPVYENKKVHNYRYDPRGSEKRKMKRRKELEGPFAFLANAADNIPAEFTPQR